MLVSPLNEGKWRKEAGLLKDAAFQKFPTEESSRLWRVFTSKKNGFCFCVETHRRPGI